MLNKKVVFKSEQADYHRSKKPGMRVKELETLTLILMQVKDCKYKKERLSINQIFILGIDVVNQVISKVKNHHLIEIKANIKDISQEDLVSTMIELQIWSESIIMEVLTWIILMKELREKLIIQTRKKRSHKVRIMVLNLQEIDLEK